MNLRQTNTANSIAHQDGGRRIILPNQSVPLSDSEFEQAQKVCDWITSLIERRDAYILGSRLDPAINNPAANWSLDHSFYDGYRALITKRYENINLLRVFSQMFSGQYLGIVSSEARPVPTSVPKALDDHVLNLLRQFEATEPWWLQRYRALIVALPTLAQLSPPQAFGETGLLLDGVIVNHDTYVYLERLALLLKSGQIDRLKKMERPVILEIGSGYGALGYFIRKLIPRSVYICIDLPESLIFSALYLSRYFPSSSLLVTRETDLANLKDHDCVFLPNYMFHRLTESNLSVDLAINTLSMSEMSASQVRAYCKGLKKMIGRQGQFFEQNQDNRHLGMIFAKNVIARYFNNSVLVSIHSDLTQGVATVWTNMPVSDWIWGKLSRLRLAGGRL